MRARSRALVRAGRDRGRDQAVVGRAALARFPTLEMRITDVCTRLEDGIAIAALFRCLLRMLWRLRRQNQRWRRYPPMLVSENRWRAQRYGIEEGLVDFGKGEVVPFPTCSRS